MSEPAKVIIVTEAPSSGLQSPVERHITAASWDVRHGGMLDVSSEPRTADGEKWTGAVVATYAPGAWLAVRDDDERPYEACTENGECAHCGEAGAGVTVERHRWYAVVRQGTVGEIVAVLAATSDGIASYDSVEAWEAANT